MQLQHTSILILLILGISLSSCASFNTKKFGRDLERLKVKSIFKLNGSYSFHPIKKYYSLGKDRPNDSNPDSLTYNNAYDFLVNEDYDTKQKFDSLRKDDKEYSIKLQLIDKKQLSLKVFENTTVIKDTFFYGKSKNGMFYIDNKFLDCKGIPYLFGGCRNNKRRIGLTKNGHLLVNEAVSNEGALFLVFGAGYSYNVTYEYSRQ